MTSSSPNLVDILCDHEVVFTVAPLDANELLDRLERIERQARNAVTGAAPVNAQAVFIQLDEIKKLLARADRSGRFAHLTTEHGRLRTQEAVAKLVGPPQG